MSDSDERRAVSGIKSTLIWAVVLLVSVAVIAYSIPIFVWASPGIKAIATSIVIYALALASLCVLALLGDRIHRNIREERRKDFRAGLLSANEGGNYQIPMNIRTGKNTYEPKQGAPKPVTPQVLHQGNDAALLNLTKEVVRELVKQRGVTVTEEPPAQLLPPMKSGRELIEDGTVQSALAQGKIILGYDDAHVLKLMKVANFFSCILAGIPNSGKSSTALWLLIQLVWAGVRIILVDPHMNYRDEDGRKGLAQELEPFKFAYLREFPPCDMDDPGSVLARVKWMKNDLLRRKRPGYVVKASEIVIMVFDEFNSVIEVEEISKELADDLAYIEREGRKFGLHVMLLGHRWAQQDIGNIKIRTCASTILAHRFNDESQGNILLGKSDGKKVLELDPGFYWLRGILAGALAKIYTPYLEAPDISLVIDAMSGMGFVAFPEQSTVVEAVETRVDIADIAQGEMSSAPVSSAISALYPQQATEEEDGDSAEGGAEPLDTTETEIGAFLSQAQKIKLLKVLEMDAQGNNGQNEIIRAVWGQAPNSRQGIAAAEELRTIRAYIAQEQRRKLGL